MALPPRLILPPLIVWEPSLPTDLADAAQATPTWMADTTKVPHIFVLQCCGRTSLARGYGNRCRHETLRRLRAPLVFNTLAPQRYGSVQSYGRHFYNVIRCIYIWDSRRDVRSTKYSVPSQTAARPQPEGSSNIRASILEGTRLQWEWNELRRGRTHSAALRLVRGS